MQAELVIDLNDLGSDVGRALGRDTPVLPSLAQVATLWDRLGVHVAAVHLIAPGRTSLSTGEPVFAEPRAQTWWEAESSFLADEDFDVEILFSVMGDHAPIAQHALLVTTALGRSDQIAELPDAPDTVVIVMSNSEAAASAVTHARGVPVIVAGTAVPNEEIAHMRLELSWMGSLANRFALLSLSEIELHDGRPSLEDRPIGSPYHSLDGRDPQVASLPSFAASVTMFDPMFFRMQENGDAAPERSGVASVVETLGLGELVHIETPDLPELDSGRSGTQLVASMYRHATDHPHLPIIIASTRPALIVVASQLERFGMSNAHRFLRLCLPRRDSSFIESTSVGLSQAARIIVEKSLSAPLFAPRAADSDEESRRFRHLGDHPISPTIVLYSNPSATKAASAEWRQATGRRFLLIGADAAAAVPADEPEADQLPLALGGCTDFTIRAPDLQPGCIVEGILNDDADGWIVVSDPIERRVRERETTAEAA